MSLMVREVYEALLEAGASEEKAVKAAEALASYDTRFDRMEQRFTKIEGDLALLKWMVGFTLAGVVGILLKVLVR
jgi:hypothetical protein